MNKAPFCLILSLVGVSRSRNKEGDAPWVKSRGGKEVADGRHDRYAHSVLEGMEACKVGTCVMDDGNRWRGTGKEWN